MRFKFEPQKRIRDTKEYKQIFEKGKKVYGSWLRIHYLIDGESVKMGVIISKKIKGAVIRNCYKRIVREFFRVNQHQFEAGAKVVVVVTTLLKAIKYTPIEEELKILLKKARILLI